MAEAQRTLHIVTEILAIPLGIFLIYVGTHIHAKKWMKTGLVVAGLGNLIIDGYMIFTWF